MKTKYLREKEFSYLIQEFLIKNTPKSFLYYFLRNGKRLSALIILLSFLIPLFSFSQVNYSPDQKWKWLHPTPQGNTMWWCRMWDKNTWYLAGDYGTFMKTSDGGTSWTISYGASNAVALQPGIVYDAHFFNQNTGILVGNFSSAYKTTNAGVSFDSIPGLYRFGAPSWNSVFFLNSNTGYLTGHSNGLVKTTDGGNTWNAITSVPDGHHYDLWTPNDNLIIICSGVGKIQRSTSGGSSWETINTPTTAYLRHLCFINNDTGFVSGDLGKVLLTTNGGLNWSDVSAGLPPLTTYQDIDFRTTSQNTEVYLTGNAYYIYKTTNFGSTWDTVGIWGANQSYMGAYMSYRSTDLGAGDTLLTVGSMGLINKRNSSGNRILYENYVRFGGTGVMSDIWVEGNKIWGVGNPTGSGGPMDDQILFSSDGGNTWAKQNTGGSTAKYTSICMINSNTGYVAGYEGSVRKTNNGGLTWDLVNSPTGNILFKVDFKDENTGWVFGTGPSIFKTTNSGLYWIQQTASVPSGCEIVDADFVDLNTGWFVGYDYTLSFCCKTTDGGLNWVLQNTNVNGAIIGIKMVDVNTGYFGGYNNFCKTTNGGANWDSLPLPYSVYQITGVDFLNAQTGMILNGFKTLKTTNGGASWIIDHIGTTAFYTTSAPTRLKMISEDIAYTVGALASILKYTGSPIGITEWETGVIEKYELFQNYPNPFNPSTTIKFAIPKAGNVTLKVYDITGKEVRTIIDNMELNAGTVTYDFNGTELSSGIYFYTLIFDGDIIDTKKMVLVK